MRQSFDLAFRERHPGHRAWKLRVDPQGLVASPSRFRISGTRAGEWVRLIDMARSVPVERSAKGAISEEERRGKAPQNRVLRGQVSRARHEGAALAPRTEATFAELPGRRPQAPVPHPGKCWILSHSSSASEHTFWGVPRVLVGAPMNCCASVWMVPNFWPQKIQLGAFMTTMTALSTKNGGVRVIATGTSSRQLVAKTSARP